MLILVRHGRTRANAGGLLQGRSDLPLDDVGQAQAAAVAAALGPVDRIIASPLRRAVETAARIGGSRGLTVEVDERWVELDYGSLEGARLSDVPDEVWTRWRTDVDFVPAGGESLADVSRRVDPALAELIDEARDRTVVVVSHVSPIKAAIAWVLEASPELGWRTHLAQAAICRIGHGPGGAVLRTFNETAHLSDVDSAS